MEEKLLAPRQLVAVYERLKRADENIQSLDIEINTFLKSSRNTQPTDDKREAAKQWAQDHVEREIPPRFPILAGEIVHHLRSCLDHLAWVLSSATYRTTDETNIAFPVCLEPAKKNGRDYNKKIKGVTSKAARDLVEELQPYKVAVPADHPLAIIAKLDNIDKHRTLVLLFATFDMLISFPPKLMTTRVISGVLEDNEYSFPTGPANKIDIKVSRHLVFAEFGNRKNEKVISALKQLSGELRKIVQRFGDLRSEP